MCSGELKMELDIMDGWMDGFLSVWRGGMRRFKMDELCQSVKLKCKCHDLIGWVS